MTVVFLKCSDSRRSISVKFAGGSPSASISAVDLAVVHCRKENSVYLFTRFVNCINCTCTDRVNYSMTTLQCFNFTSEVLKEFIFCRVINFT